MKVIDQLRAVDWIWCDGDWWGADLGATEPVAFDAAECVRLARRGALVPMDGQPPGAPGGYVLAERWRWQNH